jgi:Membrane-bound metallopeptidase
MVEAAKNKGPWMHRVLVVVFTALFSLLIFWLLDFAVSDIGNVPGQKLEDVQKTFRSPDLISRRDGINRQLDELERNIGTQKQRQSLLRDSTSRYEATLRQLLDLQRSNTQKGVKTGETQQKALADSVSLFLANQRQDQALYDQIATLSEQERQLENNKRGIQEKLDEQDKAAEREFDRLQRIHQKKLGAFKLLLLIPLLFCAVMIVIKKRSGMYGPLVYGAGAAILAQTVLVIHECFPTRYFKYVLIVAAIVVVGALLVWLLQMKRSPKPSWLLKQYRDAYEAFFCPICDYPIRRGPRRYLFWTRRTIGKVASPAPIEQAGEETYSCPACGTRLYEQCLNCNAIRHSLLRFCESCGAEKAFAARAH